MNPPPGMPPVLLPDECIEASPDRDAKGDAFEALFALKLDHPDSVGEMLKEFAEEEECPRETQLRDLAASRIQKLA
jgi:hypothetical protein